MRIGLDASYSLSREPTGVSVYSRRLIEEMASQAPDDCLLLAYRFNRYFRSFAEPKPGRNCRRRLLEEPRIRRWAGQADLFHGLNQRLPEARFRRSVATFHDLFVMTGEYSTPEFRSRFTKLAREAAARADHIVAVSDFTARQVEERLGYPREQITTVLHGADPPPLIPADVLDGLRRRHDLSGRFILHIGALQTRKNVVRLVEAFEGLPVDLRLVLAGGAGMGAEAIFERIEHSPARARIMALGYVDAPTRAALLHTATVLAFPSLDEGFGIPALEAMAAGLPAVVSNRSALPEVVGDAAVLIDPLETDSIRDGLVRVLEDEGMHQQLSRRGKERAEGLTWTRAAAETLAVYRSLS